MVKNKIETAFSSDLYKVKQIVKEILFFLDEGIPNLPDADRFDLKLIFSELLCNAVIHGNKQDMAKCVHVAVEIKGDVVFSTIADEGMGFDYFKLLSNLEVNDNLGGESGRGIRLVYSLTDSMTFSVSGNQINFHKRVGSHG